MRVRNLLLPVFAFVALVGCGSTPATQDPSAALGLNPKITGKIEGYTLGAGTISARIYPNLYDKDGNEQRYPLGSIDGGGNFTLELPNMTGQKAADFGVVKGPELTITDADVQYMELQDIKISNGSKAIGAFDKGFNASPQKQFLWFSTRKSSIQGKSGTNFYNLDLELGWNYAVIISDNSYSERILNVPWTVTVLN
jgi:hypothetical protein